jgi:mannose/cellobiose epimerase-like protein (N-acyl-D-glucosamine 2-epimerase family)
VLDEQNQRVGDRKGVAEELDYHTMGACYEVWSAIAAEGRRVTQAFRMPVR